jgi:hypothetical protein
MKPPGALDNEGEGITTTEHVRDRSHSVARQMLDSSSRFARSAVGAYVEESWDIFHLHLATAIELLLKSLLAGAHPSLLADQNASFDSLLHLAGMGHRARTPETAIRTIGVANALRRVEYLVDDYEPPSARVMLLLDARNSLVHGGQSAKAEHEAVLGDVARYVTQLLAAKSASTEEYWGEWTELVARHASRQLGALEAAYERKLAGSRQRYERLVERHAEAELESYVALMEPSGQAHDYSAAPAPCPACGRLGTASGDPDPDWEADWDYADGQAYLAGAYVSRVRLYVSAFECRVCGLMLDTALVRLAGLSSISMTETEADRRAATEYFTLAAAEGLSDI